MTTLSYANQGHGRTMSTHPIHQLTPQAHLQTRSCDEEKRSSTGMLAFSASVESCTSARAVRTRWTSDSWTDSCRCSSDTLRALRVGSLLPNTLRARTKSLKSLLTCPPVAHHNSSQTTPKGSNPGHPLRRRCRKLRRMRCRGWPCGTVCPSLNHEWRMAAASMSTNLR